MFGALGTIGKWAARIVTAAAATGAVIGLDGAIASWRGKNPIRSLSGAPPPDGVFSATESVKYLCESSGLPCTCGDVKDWLGTYAKYIDSLRESVINLNIPSGDKKAVIAINDAEAEIQRFSNKYEPGGKSWKSYDCDDIESGVLNLGSSGRERISEIVSEIYKVQAILVKLELYRAKYHLPGEVAPVNIVDRALDNSIYEGLDDDDDKGPDSGSIGLGLLAGGAIALALIMGQSKDKGRV